MATAGALTPQQRSFVSATTGDFHVLDDLSWPEGGVDTVVLRIATGDGERIVKAGGEDNHHIRREIRGHVQATGPLVERGLAARMHAAHARVGVLVLEYLPGHLVERTSDELDADVHRQAGAMLRIMHDQSSTVDDTYAARADAKALSWLDRGHHIPAEQVEAVRAAFATPHAAGARLVPTHGDWQPRNWLIDDGTVRMIDLGRYDRRAPESDLVRLAAQQWRTKPELEAAFLDGYGADPRGEDWRYAQLREAVATAGWALMVGDDQFEAQGLRMVTEALTAF